MSEINDKLVLDVLIYPISTGGGEADYALHITACPPEFENLMASLICCDLINLKLKNHGRIGRHEILLTLIFYKMY